MDVQKQARAILDLFGENGEHWTQGKAVRRDPDSNVRYCLLGAVIHLDYENSFYAPNGLRSIFLKGEWHKSIVDFNDNAVWPTIKERLLAIAKGAA